MKLERTYDLGAPKGVAGRNSDNTFIQQRPRLGAEHAAARRDGRDLRLDRGPVRGPQGRPAGRRRLTGPWTRTAAMARVAPPRRRSELRPPRSAACRTGSQLAGGWIDQPFVSALDPEPPGLHGRRLAGSRPSGSWTAAAWRPGPGRWPRRCGATPSRRDRSPAEPRPRAVRGRERRQGRAVRLAGHDRPHLPRRSAASTTTPRSTAAGSRPTSRSTSRPGRSLAGSSGSSTSSPWRRGPRATARSA